MRSRIQRSVGVCACLAVCLFISSDRQMEASNGTQTISQCTTIDRSGSYVLGKVIVADANDIPQDQGAVLEACIVIAADFVTLDLAGYAIVGPGFGRGISTDSVNRQGAKVHSGSVTNFNIGLSLEGSGHTVEHVRAIQNVSIGIATVTGPGHRLSRNVTNQNGFAGITTACPSVIVENATVNNGVFGILADPDCTRLANSPLP